jgi:hypothetical protein
MGRYLKGTSGNPHGSLPTRTLRKELKVAAAEKIEQWFNLVFIKPLPALKEYLKDESKLSAADIIVLGDVDRETVNNLLDRVMGKPAPMREPADTGTESVEAFFRRVLQPPIKEDDDGQTRKET